MSANTRQIVIRPGGVIEFLYEQFDTGTTATELLGNGEAHITRASHVEPTETEEGIRWFADMEPVSGPVLGGFRTRRDAIAAEIRWLTDNYLNRP